MKQLTKTELNNIINDQLKKKLPWEQPRKKSLPIRAAIGVLKMSRFYSYCIISRTLFEGSSRKEGLYLDLYKYFMYKMNHKCYKNLFRNDGIVLSSVSNFRKDKQSHRMIARWYDKEPVKFFIDKSTLCILKYINVEENILRIEFYGLHASKYIKKVKRILCHVNKTRNRNIEERNEIYDMYSQTNIKLERFDQIIIDESKKECIINSLNNLIQTEEVYIKYNIQRKLGILLYGKPGTGKTSVIKAIINEVKTSYKISEKIKEILPIFLDVSLSLKEFREQLNEIETKVKRYTYDPTIFIIIEEIDAILNKSRDDDNSESNSKIKLLLEFLDGFSTPKSSGTIIILASTNYYEKLDPALIRAGRFDLKIELKDFNKAQVKEMLTKYDLPEDAKIFNGKSIDYLDSFETFNFESINPAILRNAIVDYIASEYRKRISEENK